MRSLRPPRADPRRSAPPPLYGAGAPLPLLRGFGPRGPGRALRTPGGNRGAVREGPLGPGRPKPRNSGILGKKPQKPAFWGAPGIPRKRPFLGLRGATGGPPRGVDVKPPSAEGPELAKRPEKGHFCGKSPKLAILGKKAHFGAFWGFSAPSGPPGPGPGRGFYINPSRRGPAVPRGPGWDLAPPRRGGSPEGGPGGLPQGRRPGRLGCPQPAGRCAFLPVKGVVS